MLEEKIGRNNFFAGKIDFSSKICVFNNLLVVNEMIL